MSVGISLGWRCATAIDGIKNGMREPKNKGYLTCPFDICVTSYIGLCKCLDDDFQHFFDLKYLTLREEPLCKKILGDNQTEGQMWIYNTYYNFAFNHESPGHGQIYISEKWDGGINHFVSNNFEKFIERYSKRINNFKKYLNDSINSNIHVNFLISRYNSVPYELDDIIKRKYPNLKYTIHCYVNFTIDDLNLTLKKGIEGIKEFEIAYLKYLNTDEKEYPQEYERFYKELNSADFENIKSDNIKIHL